MLAQQRDDGKARTLAHRIAMRATRHERGTDEEADLRMDLAAIAGDAEELEKALGEGWKKVADTTEGVVFEYAKPEPEEPEIGLSWSGASLMGVMEEAVEARERAEDRKQETELRRVLISIAEDAEQIYANRRPYVFNGDVYMVGKADMHFLGDLLSDFCDLLGKVVDASKPMRTARRKS